MASQRLQALLPACCAPGTRVLATDAGLGASLEVQWLGLRAPNAWRPGSIPVGELRSRMRHGVAKNKMNSKTGEKFLKKKNNNAGFWAQEQICGQEPRILHFNSIPNLGFGQKTKQRRNLGPCVVETR